MFFDDDAPVEVKGDARMLEMAVSNLLSNAIKYDVMLAHMRPKLGVWAAHIETARGIGYRLVT